MKNIILPSVTLEELTKFDEAPLKIEIGNGLSCVHLHITRQMSHNDDPYAVTGQMLRNTYRELISYGIRPLIQLNSIRFGNPGKDDNLFINTVKAIGDWGYALDIPVASCDVFFDEQYSENPLLNIVLTGITETDAKKEETLLYNQLLYIAAPVVNTENYDFPAYKDKLLVETILDALKSGIIKNIWNTGNKGLLHRLFCISSKYNSGFEINIQKLVDLENNGLSAEKIINYFAHNIIFTINPEDDKILKKLFADRDIKIINAGKVIPEKIIRDPYNKTMIDLDKIKLSSHKTTKTDNSPKINKTAKTITEDIPEVKNIPLLKKIAFELLQKPNLYSRDWIYNNFDAMSGTPQIFSNVPTDATVINLKNENVSFLVAIEGNPYYMRSGYDEGTSIAVAEASRKIVCSGGIPLAMTNCCNFSTEKIHKKITEHIEKENNLLLATERLNITTVCNYAQLLCDDSGKIDKIISEPSICITGVLKKRSNLITMGFKQKGDLIYLIGETHNDISSSQYLAHYHGITNSPPPFINIEEEALVQDSLIELINNNILNSAHSISKGGLFIALSESCFPGKLGFDITTDCEIPIDVYLFGESQSRALISVSTNNETSFIDYMVNTGISFTLLGHVTKGSFRINDEEFGNVNEACKIYSDSLSNSLKTKQ